MISLDLRRLDRLLHVDLDSMTAVLEPGLRGPDAESLLAEHGLTIGHFPQSFEYASIGGFAVTRSSGQSSAGYGRFDNLVMGLTVATPLGRLDLGSSPANAAGPDLREWVMGSEGAFGVVTSVTVRVRRVPAVKVYETWRFASFDEGAAAMRTLAQGGALPTVLRLSDEAETMVNLAEPDEVGGESAGGCLMVVGFEGEQAVVDARRDADDHAAHRARRHGSRRGRWRGLGEGPLPRSLPARLDARRRRARRDRRDGHVLVPAPAGVRRRQAGAGDARSATTAGRCSCSATSRTSTRPVPRCTSRSRPVRTTTRWRSGVRPRRAASDAMIRSGASITHHHAVGQDHKPWLAEEIGPVGVEMLRAVKERIDPTGVLNPGVLVP